VLYRLAADATLLAHLAFILFVVLGATLAARWRWIAFVHVPAAAWGAFVEASGRICPLTDLENFLRARAGGPAYAGSFLEHYLLAIIYPDGLTRGVQFVLAGVVVAVNVAVYVWLFKTRPASGRPARVR